MRGQKFELSIAASAVRSLAIAGLVTVLALIFNLQILHSAAASGSITHPTPRPWGNFVPVKLSRYTLQRGKAACNYLRRQHGLHHFAAAAIVGHLIQESKVKPTGIRGDRGTAFGVAQWRGIRFKALKRFASKTGRSWRDIHAQLDFIAHELRTTERLSGRAIKASTTLEEATVAFMHYERPQGYSYANPRRGNAWSKRLSNAAFIVQHGLCWQHDREVAQVQLAGRH